MDPINNLSKVMQLLERRLSARTAQAEQKGVADNRQHALDKLATGQSAEALEQLVANRLASLNDRASSFPQAATRMFLDEILRDEFGANLWASSEFQEMLQEIQKEWQQDDEMVDLLRVLASRGRRQG
jgi:hypothetical protein